MFVLQHTVFLRGGRSTHIAKILSLEIGKFILGRQERMDFAVTLGLGNFHLRLPSCAFLGIGKDTPFGFERTKHQRTCLPEF
jgi:hypothetical protein